jgi:hypothetical protein
MLWAREGNKYKDNHPPEVARATPEIKPKNLLVFLHTFINCYFFLRLWLFKTKIHIPPQLYQKLQFNKSLYFFP